MIKVLGRLLDDTQEAKAQIYENITETHKEPAASTAETVSQDYADRINLDVDNITVDQLKNAARRCIRQVHQENSGSSMMKTDIRIF